MEIGFFVPPSLIKLLGIETDIGLKGYHYVLRFSTNPISARSENLRRNLITWNKDLEYNLLYVL